MEKQPSYQELLKMSNTDIENEQIDFKVEQKSLQLLSSISKTKNNLSIKRKERIEYLRSDNLDFLELSKKDDEITGLDGGIKRLEEYQGILFPAK